MLEIIRNRTFSFDAIHYSTYVAEGSASNVVVNHTGWTLRSQVRTQKGNKLICNLNAYFPVPTAGTIAIRHDRLFTRALKAADDLWWDLVLTNPDGIDETVVAPEPIRIVSHPTDPTDQNVNYIPQGNGVISHVHAISDIVGLQAILNSLGGVTVSDTAPLNPQQGDLWFESDTGILWVWYVDIDGGQWVSESFVVTGSGDVPADALLGEDGEPILGEDGEYILIES